MSTTKTPATPEERREARERIRTMPVSEYIQTRNQYLREQAQQRLREMQRPIHNQKDRQ